MDTGTAAPYTSPVDPDQRSEPSPENANSLTWVEIDLDAIERNARALKQRTEAALMAVVKANAYGHGAVESARAALLGGASWLGVARAEEALQLRAAGIIEPVLLLSPPPPGRLSELIAQRISLTLDQMEQLDRAAAAVQTAGGQAAIHLKVDTGMSRLGAAPGTLMPLLNRLAEEPGLTFEGFFTHFARADEADPGPVDVQLARFEEALTAVKQHGSRPRFVHAANSAATLTRPESHFDLVRCGIALYGLHPSEACRLPSDFRPALQWKAQLVRVAVLPAGTGVSYGHEYVTRADERIGTMPVGYADGLRRSAANRALVGGTEFPVVGRVCMDLSMLQLDGAPEAKSGDQVVLIGRQGEAEISAEEVARRWGTINYEVTCAIGARVPRVYR